MAPNSKIDGKKRLHAMQLEVMVWHPKKENW
jgi:hypothetical protein